MNPVFIYVYIVVWIFISLITYIAYLIDKERAKKGQWRIKEKHLLLLSVFMGSIGGLMGLYVVRHKTKHWYFIVINWLSFFLHLYLIYFIYSQVVVTN
ncbi:DUF1294 domain-containing protein [Acholeplasma laidlawii]|jgi:uncharacterized membrane protein YsdA (DUF1294 family)|uniref:DUF1294 domain-containing protein n=1 Tax=Acholeplasma laidlawii TaxID=2148 RepID=UPI001E49A692|nr:DUF1294 domain-containing protein [Acholeplasma laidlawii]